MRLVLEMTLGHKVQSRVDAFESIRRAMLRDETGIPALLTPLHEGVGNTIRDPEGAPIGTWVVTA